MDIIVNYHQMDRSEPLDELVKIKTERLLQKFKMKGKVTWTFDKENKEFLSEIHYHYHGHNFHAHCSADDIHKTVEPNLSKLEKQLEKNLTRDRIHENGI